MVEKTIIRSTKTRVKGDKRPLYEMIQKQAYELYEKRGREQRKDLPYALAEKKE